MEDVNNRFFVCFLCVLLELTFEFGFTMPSWLNKNVCQKRGLEVHSEEKMTNIRLLLGEIVGPVLCQIGPRILWMCFDEW